MNTITRRKCGNCSAAIDGACMNLVQAEFNPENVCELHETVAEFDADVAAIALFRQRIGLEPKEAA
jgi:hypothetical protein